MTEVEERRGVGPEAPQAGFDNPEAYIPRDRRRALASGLEMPDRVQGAALFADVSGFTQLTEALADELGPQRGAEELTANLNRVFHALIGELDTYGGDVIYFSGDALTCWIDGDDGLRAGACALAMQGTMARVGEVLTPAGTSVQLAMKVAVVVGSARRFVVGDPEIQLIDVLAGRLVDELAAVEQVAEKGEVILGESALESLGERVEVAERRLDGEGTREVARLILLVEPATPSPAAEPKDPLPEELVRPWLLPAVYERLRTGRGEFLAELRPAIPVFVRFSGIDYDADDDAIEKLDEFVRGAQRIFAEYGGNLLQLTLGDKGAYLYAIFGSPLAHEDDAARGAAAALEILELDRVTAARDIQIGLAHGRLRSGTYGHAMRRTFVCLGDAVNLAARLMSKAPPGQAYVAEAVQRQAGEAYSWERLPDLTVKGKAAPIAVFALTGAARGAARRTRRYELPIVGRRTELAALESGLARARERRGCVIGVAAEAGIGKSRLVAEFVRRARGRGMVVAFGECQAFGTRTSYVVWHEIWRCLLRVDGDRTDAERVNSLERELEAIDPALVPRAPLLDVVLDLSIPGNELTRSFDAELRKTSLEALLADCLRCPQFSPTQWSPTQGSAAQWSPTQWSPTQWSPTQWSPTQWSPTQWSPTQWSPTQWSPTQWSPTQWSPTQWSSSNPADPKVFSAAQTASLLAVSGRTGTSDENVSVNTWNNTGFVYVRVQGKNGSFVPGQQFTLDVARQGNPCQLVVDEPSIPTAPPGDRNTVILVDGSRMTIGATLTAKLNTFASRPEVRGVVVNVNDDAAVATLNAQARRCTCRR